MHPILLGAGANVNAVDDHGMTALIRVFASLQTTVGYTKCATMLLEAGADTRVRGIDGQTAADWAGQRPNGAILLALLRSSCSS